MKIPVPKQLKLIQSKLSVPLYVVGGYVRDYILYGTISNDVDICAPISAEDFILACQSVGAVVVAVFKKTGTVKIEFDNIQFEFTSFRYEEYDKGGVHTPKNVTFTLDINLDAKRRDFKCNAIYYNILLDQVEDVLGGLIDLEKKVISTAVSPKTVFSHDGLRLFRLARFSAKHNLLPTKNTLEFAKKYINNIFDVSVERTLEELVKILSEDYDKTVLGLSILDKINALTKLFSSTKSGYFYKRIKNAFNVIASSNVSHRLFLLILLFSDNKSLAIENVKKLKLSSAVTRLFIQLINLFEKFFIVKTNTKIKQVIIDNFNIFDEFTILAKLIFSNLKNKLLVVKKLEKWQAIKNDIVFKKTPITVLDLKISAKELIDLGIKPNKIKTVLNVLLKTCQKFPKLNQKTLLLSMLKRKKVVSLYIVVKKQLK